MARKGSVEIDREACKGCYLCIRVCSKNVLEKDSVLNESGSYPVIASHLEDCIGCGNCYAVCPDVCIAVFEEVV